MECNRSTGLRKVCQQCNTVVHMKRSVCDCGHAFASKKRKAQCTAVGEPEDVMKRKKPYCLRRSQWEGETMSTKWVRQLLKHVSRLYTGKNTSSLHRGFYTLVLFITSAFFSCMYFPVAFSCFSSPSNTYQNRANSLISKKLISTQSAALRALCNP